MLPLLVWGVAWVTMKQATASTGWTYYNQYAARSEDRYNCYCLNEESFDAPMMPRMGMDSGFEGCPVAPTVPSPLA